LTAGAMYIINDILDKKADAGHPKKKNRPIASGAVSVRNAIIICLMLIVVCIFIIYFFVPSIWPVMFTYVILNIIYSCYLKRIVIFDLLAVSAFYLLRILAGGIATSIYISHWLVLCVIFVTLFIVIGKRMSEFKHLNKREVLRYYTLDLLQHLLTLSAGLTIVSYGLYSILGSTSPWAVYSTFFVILGIFRYLFIIHTSPEAEFPEKLVISDKVILGSVLAWVVYMYLILY
jgi:4-hydroxybenzoate polyprenyltransferase